MLVDSEKKVNLSKGEYVKSPVLSSCMSYDAHYSA